MRKIYSSLLLLLMMGVAATTANAQKKAIATISETAVAELSEFETGKMYVMTQKGKGYIYEAEHTCAATGSAANNTNNRLKRNGAAPIVGSSNMSYIFTVEVITDGDNTFYAFKGQTGYIDNVDHGAGTPADPIHMTSTACTFKLSQNSTESGIQYWKMEANTTTGRKIVDSGGADTDGMVLATSASNSNIAFYEVTLGTDYSIQSLEDFMNGQKVLIANISGHNHRGYLYEKAHSCGAAGITALTTNRIGTSLEAPSMSAEDFSNYVFEVEIITADDNSKTFAFKSKTGYIDNVDRNATSAAHPVHVSEEQGTFTLTWNAGGFWEVKTTASTSANGSAARLYWNVGPADNGGLTLYNNDGNHKFMFYSIPTAQATLATAEGIADIATIGTFSAPYAAVIPDGVEAWYIAETNDEGTTATMKKVEGKAIPANEGVILTGTETGAVEMVPASYETVADINGNKLSNTASETHTAVEGDYVLAIANSKVAFYPTTPNSVIRTNKAYLNLTAGSAAIAMNFGDFTTAVNAAQENQNEAKAPVFDLSGRRVMQPVKGGIYIQNGKKFIVK